MTTIDKYYLAAEFDYHMLYKEADMIQYLRHLLRELDKRGANVLEDYPQELFEIGDAEVFKEELADSGQPEDWPIDRADD